MWLHLDFSFKMSKFLKNTFFYHKNLLNISKKCLKSCKFSLHSPQVPLLSFLTWFFFPFNARHNKKKENKNRIHKAGKQQQLRRLRAHKSLDPLIFASLKKFPHTRMHFFINIYSFDSRHPVDYCNSLSLAGNCVSINKRFDTFCERRKFMQNSWRSLQAG